MPSNDVLNRTPQHVAFKRARTLYARIVRNYSSPDLGIKIVEVYLRDLSLSEDLSSKILSAACFKCPKPSTEK